MGLWAGSGRPRGRSTICEQIFGAYSRSRSQRQIEGWIPGWVGGVDPRGRSADISGLDPGKSPTYIVDDMGEVSYGQEESRG